MATTFASTYQQGHWEDINHGPHQHGIGHSEIKSPFLTVSPYLDTAHLLDLRTIDQQCQLFALALQSLTPSGLHYATIKYNEAFNWSAIMAKLASLAAASAFTWQRQEFYVVEFRSKLKQSFDRDLLFRLDRESHKEATESGGLLKYWFGVPDTERRNLATCTVSNA